ncbi:hypothetical protein SATMO3_49270 [Sporomusa aerivorans]
MLLGHIWQHIAAADNITKIIMQLEIQYGHDRQALWRC